MPGVRPGGALAKVRQPSRDNKSPRHTGREQGAELRSAANDGRDGVTVHAHSPHPRRARPQTVLSTTFLSRTEGVAGGRHSRHAVTLIQ